MKKNKIIVIGVLLLIIAVIIAYLVVAFTQDNINSSEWDISARSGVALIWVFEIIIVACGVGYYLGEVE